ncbi:GIY-YIG nuclease family protein [Streptomyces phaeochromogenes]|uniref:GIY-YIG nuclease family protein n=1 Tax=Streptomyces phaeochromogenes TaxID=1923 RepID=UPI00369C440C
MTQHIVNCGCGRTMRPDWRRSRGAYRCGCGARIAIATPPPPDVRCVGTHKGEPCRLVVSQTEPFPLCVQHYKDSGLAEYHTWSRGTPQEIREEINNRVREKVDEEEKKLQERWLSDHGVKLVDNRIIRAEKDPIVYFIRSGHLVKIGTTVDLIKRMKEFTLPDLVVLATEPGYRKRERQLHLQFKSLRHQGEWFRLEDPLVGYINEIRGHHDVPPIIV